jgi:hypothetical protein
MELQEVLRACFKNRFCLTAGAYAGSRLAVELSAMKNRQKLLTDEQWQLDRSAGEMA